jgi:hypothetical protein
MTLTEFQSDSSWNPPTIAGASNPSHYAPAGGRYAFAGFAPTVVGAKDPARCYVRSTRWVDSTTRHHLVFEAGWPTTIGIDVTLRVHQFTLNWNNFNDFILVEIGLINTGVTDLNADGVPDSSQTPRKSLNRIHALTLMTNGEVFGSYYLTRSGSRTSRLGSARGIGYVGDPSPRGEPWDMVVAFAGESVPGLGDMGFNSFPEKFYTDVWSCWGWIGAKAGQASAGAVHLLPDKQTIYGTHPIGVGEQKGWFATAGQGKGLAVYSGNPDPRRIHTTSMGVWYADGGKSRDSTRLDLAPDTNFFLSGVPGDPTTFVPRATPGRPAGDRKLTGQFEVPPHEPAWTRGFSGASNFDGDLFSGLGPFSLEPNESMTIVWAEGGGYRLVGVENALAAARWAFEHGLVPPDAPPVPEMAVESSTHLTAVLRWDARAETFPGFRGYRIYRAGRTVPVDWLADGMRSLDLYWKTPVPGRVPDSLLQPITTAFTAQGEAADKRGEAGSWGPYQLLAEIPSSALASYRDPAHTPFVYAFEDANANPGFQYWYYVAASASVSVDLGPDYTGSHPRNTSLIETSNVNRNGATGLWGGEYPFADLSPDFPHTLADQYKIGAGIVIGSPVSDPRALSAGTVRAGVKPNPFKRQALWDTGSTGEDRVMFYNLPPHGTITILDVSGQIVHQLEFAFPDAGNGTMMWDLKGRNGADLASGLYIYVVQFDGGQQVGYLSVLR